MRNPTPALAATMMVALVLAGCSGSSSDGKSESTVESSVVVASGEALGDAGSIEGIVTDDSSVPLAEATVALVDLGLQALTDEAGAFAFTNLAPGTYSLAVVKLGYESAGKRVTVEANGFTTVLFTIAPLPISEPHVEIFGPFSAFFGCQVGTPAVITSCLPAAANSIVFPETKTQLRFPLSSEDWNTFIGESRWRQSSYATAPGMAIWMSRDNRTGNHWWCEGDGRSPVQFRYAAEEDQRSCTSRGSGSSDEPDIKHRLWVAADPGFGGTTTENPPVRLIVQQRFELMMSVFYLDPPPPEYTAFPDT